MRLINAIFFIFLFSIYQHSAFGITREEMIKIISHALLITSKYIPKYSVGGDGYNRIMANNYLITNKSITVDEAKDLIINAFCSFPAASDISPTLRTALETELYELNE